MRQTGFAFALLLSLALGGAGAPARGAEPKLGPEDSIQSLIVGQMGARITVRLRSGQEFNGIVRAVNARAIHLGTLGGKEFFDAVIPLDAVEAVFFRTKQ